MIEKIIYSESLVEYKNIPGRIDTILQKMGLKVGAPSGAKLVEIKEQLGGKLGWDDSSLHYASREGVDYLGFWHWNRPEPHSSSVYLHGGHPDNQDTSYDLMTYVFYLQIFTVTINKIESSTQINDVGMRSVLEEFLGTQEKPFIPKGPAVQIYEQVKKVHDSLTEHSNQNATLMQLKAIYKEYSGAEFSVVQGMN